MNRFLSAGASAFVIPFGLVFRKEGAQNHECD